MASPYSRKRCRGVHTRRISSSVYLYVCMCVHSSHHIYRSACIYTGEDGARIDARVCIPPPPSSFAVKGEDLFYRYRCPGEAVGVAHLMDPWRNDDLFRFTLLEQPPPCASGKVSFSSSSSFHLFIAPSWCASTRETDKIRTRSSCYSDRTKGLPRVFRVFLIAPRLKSKRNLFFSLLFFSQRKE